MIIEYHGPFINIHIYANELQKNQTSVKLRNGYSYESIYVNSLLNKIAKINKLNEKIADQERQIEELNKQLEGM